MLMAKDVERCAANCKPLLHRGWCKWRAGMAGWVRMDKVAFVCYLTPLV